MAINPALLICAPILQDYFSDNATDAAMSAGIITCYQDNSRTTLKNWYYQTGMPGAYTYTQLPNPLTLSAAGTITDAMGNDTIPFWYPYSETDNATPQPYYVTVDNSNGQRQFTRQNFPFVAPNSSNVAGSNTLRNLIVNNVFWRNAGTVTLTDSLSQVLAPSQHDGYISNMADMIFVKNATGATDIATFTQFTNINRLMSDATPEFYLNMSCANTGTSETVKYIQMPICLHVDNLSGYTTASATMWTQNVGGTANNTITLSLYQFLGTGTTSPAATTLITITPSTMWQKTVVNFSFPVATLPPGGPGDDGWFLQIGFPVGVTYNMNIAKPSVYLSTAVPSDDFDTYEYTSAFIDSARTGDVRTSINSYYPYGWVTMNGGTIGNASSNATARANIDTWPLFSLLWNLFAGYTSGSTNVLAQMVNSSAANIPYSDTAIIDFNANNAITLTKSMGQVLLGTVPAAALLPAYATTFTASSNVLTAANNVNFFNGMPVYFTGTTTLATGTIYYVSGFNGTTGFSVSTTFNNAISGNVVTVASDSGKVYAALPGSYEGEYAHSLIRSELPDPITGTAIITNAGVGVLPVIGSGTAYGAGTVSNMGGNNAHNNTQPGTFYNLYMKL